MIDKAPPGPIKTKWGLAFRDFDECVAYIRASNSLKAPEGGVTLPLQYTVYERPTYSVVPSNAIWRDPARADVVATLRENEADNRRRDLFFPQVLRDARRIGEYYPGLPPDSPECMDRLGLALAHLESKCANYRTKPLSSSSAQDITSGIGCPLNSFASIAGWVPRL